MHSICIVYTRNSAECTLSLNCTLALTLSAEEVNFLMQSAYEGYSVHITTMYGTFSMCINVHMYMYSVDMEPRYSSHTWDLENWLD